LAWSYHIFSVCELPSIFEQQIDFDPAGDIEAFLRAAPPKWVVYLLSDADDRPVQLLCVKNLRYSLKRRLGPGEAAEGVSRRVDYRQVVRRVRWRRVDSAFEADWVYYEAARQVFPESYRGMVGFRPAWFLHVDPQAAFPRYVKTTDLSPRPGELIGPVEDKHAAARLIEMIEDAFDLCRYHNVLIQAPGGSACAYKEMGRCPAPCDGSISLEQYRRLIEWSASVVVDPAEMIRDQTRRMQGAAAELRFEIAGRIKAYIDRLAQFGAGPFRHIGRLANFNYVCLQHGPRPQQGDAKVFLITPGRIEQILSLVAEPTRPSDVLRTALSLSEAAGVTGVDAAGAERMGIVSHHLFSPKKAQGIFLRMDSIGEKALVKAFGDLRKQSAPPEEAEEEGVMRELQSL
jgi:hypothetical protein